MLISGPLIKMQPQWLNGYTTADKTISHLQSLCKTTEINKNIVKTS